MDMHLLYNRKTAHPDRSELDFVNHWVEKSVKSSILQGQQLQKLKEYRPMVVVEEYDVNNVDLNRRPFCETSTARSQSTNATKKTKKKKCKKTGHRPNKESSESIKTYIIDECICPIKKRKRKRQKKCPMRVIQLAVPTKRQCLETWKMNCRILPDIMIDRLRQYVRDQRPVVQISDAIHCFQRGKKTRKVKKKKIIKKDMKRLPKVDINTIKLTDARNFCGVFGFKISQELNKPRVIQLNTELERIANMVTMDIADLLSSDKKIETIKDNARNQSMCDEISGKIAIWIWGILEESYHKILEDQLRDLDEELGPALDILDEIIDNVVDLCEPEPLVIDIPYIPYIPETAYSEAASVEEENIDEATDNKSGISDTSINIEAAILNDLNNILDKFIEDDVEVNNGGSEDIAQEDAEKLSDVRSLEDKENEFQDAVDLQRDEINDHIQDEVTNQLNQVEDEINELGEEINKQVDEEGNQASQAIDETNEGDEINDQVEDEEGNQVSDFPEDGNKKVTFEVESVTADFWFQERWNRPRKSYKEQSPEVHWPSLSAIHFSKPNEHLLSEVDETWPLDILKDKTILRPSASISKSISSLGNTIFETEDTTSESKESDIDLQLLTPSELHETELDKNTDYTLLEDDFSKDKAIDITNLKDAIEQYLHSKSVQTSIELSNTKQYKSEGINTSPIRSRTDIILGHTKAVTSFSLDDFGKKSDQKTSLKKSRPNYKVHPCTAPSWALRGFTETSGHPCLRKQPINQCRTRQWCNDLLIGYNNLELWNDWIVYASKLIRDLESRKVTRCNNKFAKERTKLRYEIDSDATTWTNKHRCIRKHLKEYKDLYQKTPICKIKSSPRNHCLCLKKSQKTLSKKHSPENRKHTIHRQ